MICENLPRYGVVVVVVVVTETKYTSEIEKIGVEISDMFLRKVIVTYQKYKFFWKNKIKFS
ncbi:hypothetical protein IX39_02185 [Chryseobacterium formosense]|uniref:Uncharacterized protein n=1 Tax=Chryseobacterium formosense TaxID=236814 RepID=A0A085Z4Y3_9FLAO|nr:hypothetical protein IX39_02185 [Chryseobacterium formosense]SFT81508.1 hypothetical protein SAMN05421857_3447 [Chryseobacterium formosense]